MNKTLIQIYVQNRHDPQTYAHNYKYESFTMDTQNIFFGNLPQLLNKVVGHFVIILFINKFLDWSITENEY